MGSEENNAKLQLPYGKVMDATECDFIYIMVSEIYMQNTFLSPKVDQYSYSVIEYGSRLVLS